MKDDERYLQFAESVARGYKNEPLPQDAVVPVSDAGTVIALFADMYDVTRKKAWLDEGLKTADSVIDVYFDHDLPRGEAHINYYYSQMGPRILIHSLARIALLALDPDNCLVEPDYSAG